MAYYSHEFIPGHYCRDCGWPFAASAKRTVCQAPAACQRRQALPIDKRGPGCPYNDRVHPEWRALGSSSPGADSQLRGQPYVVTTPTAPEGGRPSGLRPQPASREPGRPRPHDDAVVRVVSWNVHFRGAATASRQGELLRTLSPDLILLQEVNPRSAEILRKAAGADWLVCSYNLRTPAPGDRPARSRGVAIAGRGLQPSRTWLLANVALPERVLIAETRLADTCVTVISYHAPPGVTWGLVKPRQAVALASWLASQHGPAVLGADANTPLIDAADFAATRTHWHTGDRHLHGEPGDDLLFGPAKIHPLDDALRRWLADTPHTAALAAGRPLGPLAVTHRTGLRKNSPGTGRRFDSIWITRHWTATHVSHLYDDAITAGSDHAIVVADLTLTDPTTPDSALTSP